MAAARNRWQSNALTTPTKPAIAMRLPQLRAEPPKGQFDFAAALERIKSINPPLTTAFLGYCTHGDEWAPLLVRLASLRKSQVLVAGGEATGKTTVLRALAASVLALNQPRAVQVVLPPTPDFDDLREYDAAFSLDRLPDLIKSRQTSPTSAPLLVVVADQLDEAPAAWRKRFEWLSSDEGLMLGFRLMAATRCPTQLGEMVGDFPIRLIGRLPSAEARAAANYLNTTPIDTAQLATGRFATLVDDTPVDMFYTDSVTVVVPATKQPRRRL